MSKRTNSQLTWRANLKNFRKSLKYRQIRGIVCWFMWTRNSMNVLSAWKGFERERCLRKHMLSHSRQRPYKRRTGFSQRARMSARSGEKQYACRKCKMKYTALKSLERHMLVSHSQDSLSEVLNSNSHLEESPRNFPVTNSDGFTCRTCGQLFNFQHDLQEHLSLNHTGIYPNSPSNFSFSDQVDRKFSCPDCGKCFKRRSHMTEHQLIHKLHETGVAAYRCQECQKQFFHKGHFNVHVRTHSGERPYGCLMCSRNFNTNAQLNRHLTSHHKDLNGESYCDPFTFTHASNALNEDFRKSDDGDSKLTKDEQSCTFFETISQETQNLSTSLHSNESQIERSTSPLKQHSKKNRTERVSYLCDVCNKQFFHKGSYTVHIRTHTGEKPFACIICNRKFNTKSQLNRHMSVHTDKKSDQESDHSKQNCEKEEDDGTTERNYQCNFCGKRFKRRSHLNEHQLLHKTAEVGRTSRALYHLWQTISNAISFEGPHEKPRRGKTVCLSAMFQTVPIHDFITSASEISHRRTAVQMLVVRKILQAELQPEDSHDVAHGWKAIRVSGVWQEMGQPGVLE